MSTPSRRMLCGVAVALRPTLSPAAQAKAKIASIEARLTAARRAGDATKIEELERERAWAVMNSMR